MSIRKLLVSFIFILSFGAFAQADGQNQSTELWNNYYPTIDCLENPCGVDVPHDLLKAFFEKSDYYEARRLHGSTWAFITDMRLHSSKKRGYLLNLKTGAVEKFHVAHGKNTGDGSGNAVKFSNIANSKKSSYGLYITAETYYGKHGLSLKMDGLEESNSNARGRYIVIHGAKYMTKSFINTHGRAGRSWGCPAVAPEHNERLIELLKEGSLYYIHK